MQSFFRNYKGYTNARCYQNIAKARSLVFFFFLIKFTLPGKLGVVLDSLVTFTPNSSIAPILLCSAQCFSSHCRRPGPGSHSSAVSPSTVRSCLLTGSQRRVLSCGPENTLLPVPAFPPLLPPMPTVNGSQTRLSPCPSLLKIYAL